MERNTGRARRKHRRQGDEEHDATTWEWQGNGPPVEAGRVGKHACGWWRQTEGGKYPWEGEHWVQQGPYCAGRGRQRGRNRTREGRHRLARGTPRAAYQGRKAQTIGGGWKAVVQSRWTVALRLGKMGLEKRLQREREAFLTGERWEAIGDRSEGREKRNERSRKR